MQPTDRRTESRKRVAIPATAYGPFGTPAVKCAIRDASREGCQLISSFVDELPDAIEIVVHGIEQPIYGTIVWRRRRMAGVRFEWPRQGRELEDAPDWLDLDADLMVD